MDIQVLLFRKGCARSDKKRDAGLTIPEDVTYISGLKYAGGPENDLHVAYPKGAGSPLPTILSFHGGGYVYGSADVYKYYCASLARRGFTVINFNYRLAPDCIFPAPLEDTNAVMEWAIRNKDEFFIDTDNIFIVGDSAGAQLASQYAAICTSPEYADIMGIHPPQGFKLRALGLNCGMYDTSMALGEKNPAISAYFTKKPEKFGRMLRVFDYICADYPPAFLISSPGDFLLSHCEPMARLINERGGTAEYRIYGDEKTGHVFHVDMRSPCSKTANDDETEFFKKHLSYV
ncbi:MAG: alpha/beta hydrolase [Oscillospiraceae bacterium]|nr:alpha/beta hydrolase [Oscillospiraceae bacterium]